MRRVRLLVLLLLGAVLGACGGEDPAPSATEAGGAGGGEAAAEAPAAPEPAPYEGLRVHLEPLEGTTKVALVVLFDVGGDHDPAGRSGLAHMVEHCYVTCRAGDIPARTAGELMAAYPGAWNAQTGSRYTVIATVFEADRLDDELAEAAARMGDLRITQEDLDRELPRVLLELHNMFDAIPTLVSRNRARERARPTPREGRKAGAPDEVRALGLEDVKGHWARYYKPRNARIVLAGALPEDARARVEAAFADVPVGKPLPRPGEPGEPSWGPLSIVRLGELPAGQPGHLAVGYRAPLPDDPRYPAFLVIAANLAMSRDAPFQFAFTPLDDPWACYLMAPVAPGEAPGEALDRLTIAIRPHTTVTAKEKKAAQDAFANFLDTRPLPAFFRVQNLYGTAFAIGRRAQLGIDGPALRQAIEAVDAEAVNRAARDFFDPTRRAPVAAVPAE